MTELGVVKGTGVVQFVNQELVDRLQAGQNEVGSVCQDTLVELLT